MMNLDEDNNMADLHNKGLMMKMIMLTRNDGCHFYSSCLLFWPLPTMPWILVLIDAKDLMRSELSKLISIDLIFFDLISVSCTPISRPSLRLLRGWHRWIRRRGPRSKRPSLLGEMVTWPLLRDLARSRQNLWWHFGGVVSNVWVIVLLWARYLEWGSHQGYGMALSSRWQAGKFTWEQNQSSCTNHTDVSKSIWPGLVLDAKFSNALYEWPVIPPKSSIWIDICCSVSVSTSGADNWSFFGQISMTCSTVDAQVIEMCFALCSRSNEFATIQNYILDTNYQTIKPRLDLFWATTCCHFIVLQ